MSIYILFYLLIFYYYLESEMDFYETPNTTTKKTPIHIMKQQTSITFIGDLASTSTPTQNIDEPITSTPNASTHNALKYHPSRTIRNKKLLKRNLFTVESNKNELKIQDIEHLFKQHKKLLKIKSTETKTCQHNRQHHHHHHHHQQQHQCPCLNAYHEVKRLAHSSPKIYNQVRKQTTTTKSSNIELRLKDLLYTPTKLKQLIRKQQQQEELKKLQNYYRYKSELTTPTSTPAKAGALCTSSKIYYL
jgi:hypothetical protein